MLVYECPSTPLKISLPQNETTVNLKSASFVVIMLLHGSLTHIHSQIKPRLVFAESFTLNFFFVMFPRIFHPSIVFPTWLCCACPYCLNSVKTFVNGMTFVSIKYITDTIIKYILRRVDSVSGKKLMNEDVNSHPHLSPAPVPFLSVSPQTPPSWMSYDPRGRRTSLLDIPALRHPLVMMVGTMSLLPFLMCNVGDAQRCDGGHGVGCGQKRSQWAGALTVGRSAPRPASSVGRWGHSQPAADRLRSRGRAGSGCFPLGSELSAADSMGADRDGW